jgi:predicted Ser/Thr protein kinase
MLFIKAQRQDHRETSLTKERKIPTLEKIKAIRGRVSRAGVSLFSDAQAAV